MVGISKNFEIKLNKFAADGVDTTEASALRAIAAQDSQKSRQPTDLSKAYADAFDAKTTNDGKTSTEVKGAFRFFVNNARQARVGDLIVSQLRGYFRKNDGKLPPALVDIAPKRIRVTDFGGSIFVVYQYNNGIYGLDGSETSKALKAVLTGTLKSQSVGMDEKDEVSPKDAERYAAAMKKTLYTPEGVPTKGLRRAPAHIDEAPSFNVDLSKEEEGEMVTATGDVVGDRLVLKVAQTLRPEPGSDESTVDISWYDFGKISDLPK
jgi:hypothetical protein